MQYQQIDQKAIERALEHYRGRLAQAIEHDRPRSAEAYATIIAKLKAYKIKRMR